MAVTLSIKKPTGKVVTLAVSNHDLIRDVIAKLQEVEGLSNQQKLMHRQRFLEGHRQVGHYFPFNGDGCIIHLATQVFVKDQTGTLTPYFFESYDTVLTLKNSITDKKGYQPREQRLTFDEDVLEDHKTMIDYGIAHNSTIALEICSTMEIVVDNMYGWAIPLKAESNELIKDLKDKIWEEQGFPPHLQQLSLDGTILEDTRMLADYKIQNESIIHLKSKEILDMGPGAQKRKAPAEHAFFSARKEVKKALDILQVDLLLNASADPENAPHTPLEDSTKKDFDPENVPPSPVNESADKDRAEAEG